MPIVCVAIVNQANDPIYMKSFKETQDPLEFDFLAFSALDMIEEKCMHYYPQLTAVSSGARFTASRVISRSFVRDRRVQSVRICHKYQH